MLQVIKESEGIKSTSWAVGMNSLRSSLFDPQQVNATHPCEVEVIKERNFLRRHDSCRPDWLHPYFFMDGIQVLTVESTKVMGTT